MATNKNTSQVSMPEKFQRVGSVSNAPWFSLEPSNEVEGVLNGMYVRNDERAASKKSRFFQITTSKPCRARYGKGEKAEVREAPAGTVINLNYGAKTKDLKNFAGQVMAGAKIEVFVHCGQKMTIGGGKTMWDIACGVNVIEGPKVEEPDFEDEPEDAE